MVSVLCVGAITTASSDCGEGVGVRGGVKLPGSVEVWLEEIETRMLDVRRIGGTGGGDSSTTGLGGDILRRGFDPELRRLRRGGEDLE